MLVDDHETYFWYPKEDASGDEDNETFVRVPAGSGITGHVLRTRELLAVDGPARDERYDPTIDAVMGTLSSCSACEHPVLMKPAFSCDRLSRLPSCYPIHAASIDLLWQ